MTAVVFDIGNVLVQWDAHAAFVDRLGSREAVSRFFDRINFPALNLRGDAGETFASLALEIADPGDRALFESYIGNYHLTITEAIEGSWDILARLAAAGREIHAITNWSAETWPIGLSTHPRLASSFGVTVVSGQERVLKPAPEIFAILCDRAGRAPEACLFIDDSAKNVAGARAFGMDAVQFTTPGALETALAERGLL